MDVIYASETSVTLYQTTRRHITEIEQVDLDLCSESTQLESRAGHRLF
jgi:hypothetical protein